MSGSVLIVDIDQGFVSSVQNVLEAQGLTVFVRDDAPMSVIRELRPSIMMLNVELARGSGFSVCSRIRSDRDRALRQTPILLMGAPHDQEALQTHAQSANRANDYAQKPISDDDLLQRVTKLLAEAPEPPEEEESTDPGVDEELPALGELSISSDNLEPPPIKRSADNLKAVQPGPPGPPGPPPLKKSGGKGPPPIHRPPPSSASMPALSKELLGLWPAGQFEEGLKEALAGAHFDPPAMRRATPDQLKDTIRQLVKNNQTKDRTVKDIWTQMQLKGQELARQVAQQIEEGQSKDSMLDELNHKLGESQTRQASIEGEFTAFQEEITRIFQEKDSEEQERNAQYAELEEHAQGITQQLQDAQEHLQDDQKRLTFLQEELETLQTEMEALDSKYTETHSALETKTQEASDLDARLRMTEDVASERADEVTQLRDQLDQLAFEASQERQALEQSHQTELEELKNRHAEQVVGLNVAHSEALHTLETENKEKIDSLTGELTDRIDALSEQHQQELESLKSDHETQVNALEGAQHEQLINHQTQIDTLVAKHTQALIDHEEREAELNTEREEALASAQNRHADLVESLNQSHSAEIASLTEARDLAQTELETVTEQRDQLTQQRDELQRQLSDVQAEASELNEQVDTLSSQRGSLSSERNELTQELEALKEEFERTNIHVAQLESTLSSERDTSAERIAQLETDLGAEKSTSTDRIAKLEEELESAQTQVFEQLAELDRYKKTSENLEGQNRTMGTALQASEEAVEEAKAAQAEAERIAQNAERDRGLMEEQVAALEEQHTRLEEAKREDEQMLEQERERYQRAEDLLVQAKGRLDQLQGLTEGQTQELTDTQAALQERIQVNEELERQLSEALGGKRHISTDLENERESRKSVERELEALKSELNMKVTALASAETSRQESGEELLELRETVEERDQAVFELRAELDGSRSENNRLQRRMDEMAQQMEALQNTQDELKSKLELAEQENHALETDRQSIATELEDKSKTLDEESSARAIAEAELARVTQNIRPNQDELLSRAASILTGGLQALGDPDDSELSDDLPKLQTAVHESEDLPSLNTEDISQLSNNGSVGEEPPTFAGAKAPFSSLVDEANEAQDLPSGEAQATDDEFASVVAAFADSFDEDNAPSTDAQGLLGHAGQTSADPPEEEEERAVTEIITLSELE